MNITEDIEDKLKFYAKVEEFTKNPKARLLLLSHKVRGLSNRGLGPYSSGQKE